MDWVIISAVITAVATFVLAFFNIIYVRLVRKMLISSHRPEIIVGYNWNKFTEGGLRNDDFILLIFVDRTILIPFNNRSHPKQVAYLSKCQTHIR